MKEHSESRRYLMKALACGLTLTWAVLGLSLIWPAPQTTMETRAISKSPEANGTNYLVIAPQALQNSANAWAEFRERSGYQARLEITTTEMGVEEIRSLIQQTYFESGEPQPFYVLLIGHAHSASSHPDAFLPAPHFMLAARKYSSFGPDPIATDDGYAAISPETFPGATLPISIGRIPARNEEEALSLLERTQRYEGMPPAGEGRARVELITSDAGFGPQYDPILKWSLQMLVQKDLPDEYSWHLLDGKASSPYSFPPDQFPQEAARRFDSGSLAVVYIGHGQPEMLAWAYAADGTRGPIFHEDNAGLIKAAGSSLGIFTACSAGAYSMAGDDLSVVEAIYLTPGGPVVTYSSSAWINGALNGRLVIDIFEALLVNEAPTIGEWAGQVEMRSISIHDRNALTELVRHTIPRLSGLYRNSHWISRSEAQMEMDIQHASYNLFGDPALQIAYPKGEIELIPRWIWLPFRGSIDFSGTGHLEAGKNVSISLERFPAAANAKQNPTIDPMARYLEANNPVAASLNVKTGTEGSFEGSLIIPRGTPGGTYRLRALAVGEGATYAAARTVTIGWLPIQEILCSGVFWWLLISSLLLVRERRKAAKQRKR